MNNRWYHRIVSCPFFKALWVTWIQAQSWCCLEKIISHTDQFSQSCRHVLNWEEKVALVWSSQRRFSEHAQATRRLYGSNELSLLAWLLSTARSFSLLLSRALYSLSWVSVERSVVSLLHTVALNWELSVYIFLPAGSVTLPQVF